MNPLQHLIEALRETILRRELWIKHVEATGCCPCTSPVDQNRAQTWMQIHLVCADRKRPTSAQPKGEP